MASILDISCHKDNIPKDRKEAISLKWYPEEEHQPDDLLRSDEQRYRVIRAVDAPVEQVVKKRIRSEVKLNNLILGVRAPKTPNVGLGVKAPKALDESDNDSDLSIYEEPKAASKTKPRKKNCFKSFNIKTFNFKTFNIKTSNFETFNFETFNYHKVHEIFMRGCLLLLRAVDAPVEQVVKKRIRSEVKLNNLILGVRAPKTPNIGLGVKAPKALNV
nr:hypothetical protein [Tanacetum cinerariifolium]